MKYEAIKIGDKAELTHVITQSDIENFVKLSGDDNKIHVDKEYATKTSLKKPVAHGMLGVSFISTIIGTKLPGDGALWYAQNLEFLLPVRVGDTITVKAEVLNKFDKLKAIELSTEIFNQYNQKVTTGSAKVKILPQEENLPSAEQVRTRTALVIGATGGIGRAVCRQLAKDGFDIVIHYNNNSQIACEIKKEVESEGKNALTVSADITNEASVAQMLKTILRHFDSVPVVVNCAGIRIPGIKFKELTWDVMQQHFDLNIKGLFNIMKQVVPVMEKAKYGKIICLSTLAVEKPNPEWAFYITAKSALNGFVKALAAELAPKGININLVSPGMTDTELIADIPEKVKLVTAAQTPLRRLANAEDVAGAVSFLAGEKSDFITGETIRVNGGQVML